MFDFLGQSRWISIFQKQLMSTCGLMCLWKKTSYLCFTSVTGLLSCWFCPTTCNFADKLRMHFCCTVSFLSPIQQCQTTRDIVFEWQCTFCCIYYRLMKRGLDVNHKHQLGWTALQVAVVNKNVQYAVVTLSIYHLICILFDLNIFVC